MLAPLVLLGSAVACDALPPPEPEPPAAEAPLPVTEAAPLTLDLGAMDYRSDYLDLFRSSAFFNPRTRFGSQSYLAFEDHYAVRPFAAFSWPLSKASDAASFRRGLESQRKGMTQLAALNDKVIVLINYMPRWLSRSSSRQKFEGFVEECNLYGPRDADGWRMVIRELAEFFGSLEADAEIYYEIWNEPDIQYWRDTQLAYLELYELTARTLREVHPEAKIGGAAVSFWRGKIGPAEELDYLNIALIKFAKERDLPLDFISWHDFNSVPRMITRAAEVYEAAINEAGYETRPEFVVSEWNVTKVYRGKSQQAALMADTMLTFVEAGVDVQTFAAWENFHPDPDPDPHGLVTQGGKLTGAYLVHAAFDGFVRGTDGVVMTTVPGPAELEGKWRIGVARRPGNAYRLLIWRNGFDPAMAIAVQEMFDAGLARDDLIGYRGVPEVSWCVRNGRARDPQHQKLFEAARRTYEVNPLRARALELELADAASVEVVAATAIKSDSRDVDVTVEGNRLRCDLAIFEVLVLDLVVEPNAEE